MNQTGAPLATPAAPPSQPQKPIRFVTNHDGPYAKRRRINSACLTCRRKKTRCSGERPVCGTCQQNKHECAGYGDDANSNDTPKSFSKPSQKQKDHNVIFKTEPPVDPQLTRPTLQRSSASAFSQTSESSLNRQTPITASDDGSARSNGLSLSTRNRMPYFRYFGPTAIMPGFKQMVVKVRGNRHGSGQTTSDQLPNDSSPAQPSIGSPPVPDAQPPSPFEIPLYDASAMPPSPLITHLCKLFFLHLGCSFPFLQRDRFMRDLEEKQVDAILVDAVCAMAARFSTHPLLRGETETQKEGVKSPAKSQPWEYGQAFAQRAKSAIPDAFPCPSVAVVQAALLLAYDEFGASRDSGLWMYLGIAIRMAQDLGMQTLEGLKYEGRQGPTPKSIRTDAQSRRPSIAPTLSDQSNAPSSEESEQRAAERERLDTFWSIFFLDRVISSGTGRPVTLHDRDIEISFPSLDDVGSEWPSPFPALIRIIHLYGRVTDLLNRIRSASDVTDELQRQLGALEDRLTLIYQNLSPKLHFNAINFQHYSKINQGTNFILLHCWFHTLIILLHQPTLLKPIEGTPQTLSTNSRELSMSSAKTVADILAFTELIDAKSGMGSPFTSQPIYIAACAFLKETAMHSASSQPHSRPSTPDSSTENDRKRGAALDAVSSSRLSHIQDRDQKQAAKHTLLASAANQNYQRCYRALKTMESSWAGVKYILTVLDQKATGVGDPLLYTREEMESALEVPRPEPSFTSPGWRRKLSWGTYLTAEHSDGETAKLAEAIRKSAKSPLPGSPMVHPNQAIGWSLTGTMNSPSTNVAVMYSSENNNSKDTKTAAPRFTDQPSLASIMSDAKFDPNQQIPQTVSYQPFDPSSMPPPPTQQQSFKVPSPDPSLVSDADLLLNLHSPFSSASPSAVRASLSAPNTLSYTRTPSLQAPQVQTPTQDFSPTFLYAPQSHGGGFGDMVIDTQDVDMSVLGPDMMPWDLEYLPHDMLYFADGGGFEGLDGSGGAGAN